MPFAGTCLQLNLGVIFDGEQPVFQHRFINLIGHSRKLLLSS